QEVSPQLTKLQTELKDDKEKLARETWALFKKHKVNPFSSIFLLILQIPIIIGLYSVFLKEAQNTGLSFDPALIYDFFLPLVASAPAPSFLFLGLIDLKAKSYALAALVAISQVLLMQIAMPDKPKPTGNTFRDDLSRSMHINMRYVFPVIMAFVAYATGGAVALYFLVSNIFGIAQTWAVKRIHAPPSAQRTNG
ncbi:MAG: membrane protein insertase YidC, partial [Patescibacteria group bacterium]